MQMTSLDLLRCATLYWVQLQNGVWRKSRGEICDPHIARKKLKPERNRKKSILLWPRSDFGVIFVGQRVSTAEVENCGVRFVCCDSAEGIQTKGYDEVIKEFRAEQQTFWRKYGFHSSGTPVCKWDCRLWVQQFFHPEILLTYLGKFDATDKRGGSFCVSLYPRITRWGHVGRRKETCEKKNCEQKMFSVFLHDQILKIDENRWKFGEKKRNVF